VLTAQFDLTNTGSRDGAEVAELYVHQDHPSLMRPEQELKGFQKVFLKAGETKTVSVPLDLTAFAFYDDVQHHWVAESDDFNIRVGGSSRDVPVTASYHLPVTQTLP